MPDLYIIVHEEAVEFAAEDGEPGAKQIYKGIESLDAEKKISVDGNPWQVSPGLPPPNSDLFLYVAGAHKWMYCVKQLYSLRKAGYRAGLLEELCLDEKNYRLNEGEIPPDFRDYVPEFAPSRCVY